MYQIKTIPLELSQDGKKEFSRGRIRVPGSQGHRPVTFIFRIKRAAPGPNPAAAG
jgi:hypothetical protein